MDINCVLLLVESMKNSGECVSVVNNFYVKVVVWHLGW